MHEKSVTHRFLNSNRRILLLVLLLSIPVSGICGVEAKIGRAGPPRWIDPLGRRPSGFIAWRGNHENPGPPRFAPIEGMDWRSGEHGGAAGFHGKKQHPLKYRAETVLVIVSEELSQALAPELQRFADDLSIEGKIPVVESWTGGAAADLRDHIVDVYGTCDLEGVLLVGDLPIAWWEDSYWGYEEFPIDYFFMELDGNWIDNDGDGMYDNLSGDVGPEIWAGRLYASNLTWGSEEAAIRNYFNKNHDYRTGNLSISHWGLSFVDDDWSYWGDCDLDRAYGNVTTVTSSNQTVADNYKTYLVDGYEWVHLCAHSCPWAHTFMINGGYPGGGSVLNCEIDALGPRALFYNLFNCSGTRYTEIDNIGTLYTFDDRHGLAVIGSSKTGSMLDFYSFYDPLGDGLSIGDAYREWWVEQARSGFSSNEKAWYFGLNILGDPTLDIFMGGGDGGLDPKVAAHPLEEQEDWTVSCVSDDPDSDCRPAVTSAGGGNAWAFWESGRDVRLNIYGCNFSGGAWGPASVVNSFQYWDAHPAACTDSTGRAWVFWQSFLRDGYGYRFEIYGSYRSGSTWSSAKRVSGTPPSYCIEPAAAVDASGTVFCAWTGWEDLRPQIYAARWLGSSWSSAVRISDSGKDNLHPAISALPDGRLFACWSESGGTGTDIAGAFYDDGAWDPPSIAASPDGADTHPACSVSGAGNIVLTWRNCEGGFSAVFASIYDGAAWSPPERISNPITDAVAPSTASHGNETWCVWMRRTAAGWKLDAARRDAATGWSPPEPAVNEHNRCYDPACFILDGVPRVLYASDPAGHWNIYEAIRP